MSHVEAHIAGSHLYATDALGLPDDEAKSYAQMALNSKRWQVMQITMSAEDLARIDRTLETMLAGNFEFPQL